MLERISKNEERLDNVLENIKELEGSLEKFKSNRKNITLLNKYYGSKTWFKDKEAYEQKKISNIKAGVLSEDAIWNMDEDIRELIKEMKKIIKSYK